MIITMEETVTIKGRTMKIVNHVVRMPAQTSCSLMKGVRYEGENDEVHVYYMHLGENDGILETAVRKFGQVALKIKWTVVCSYNPNKFEVRVLNNSSSIMMFPL